MSARTIVLVNQKGGVGKTTTAVNLAAGLSIAGQRVLLVDLDPQANATSASGIDRKAGAAGIYDALIEEAPPAGCVVHSEEGFDVMPAGPALTGAEVELVPVVAREHRLKGVLRPLLESYDWILIDCPPSLGLLTVNALTAANSVIIPVQTEYMALEGLSRLMETLDLVRQNLNPALGVFGLVLTMFDARTRLAQGVVDDVRSHFGATVFETIIPRAVRLSEAPGFGQSIFRYDSEGRSAAIYEALTWEVLARGGVTGAAPAEVTSLSQPRRGLGRGLDALISAQPPQLGTDGAGAAAGIERRGWPVELDIDLIAPNPEQPRTHFEPEQLRELADSIREHGILQPLVVSRDSSGGVRLIAGERRLQAARLAGLATAPVIFREAAGKDLLELALIENIQRADLNAIEEAAAYRRLIDEHGLTQEETAKRVGKSRVAVANSLRLLSLDPEIRRSLVSGEISEGHARALLALPEGRPRIDAWREVMKRHMSVRETEAFVRRSQAEAAEPGVETARGVKSARRDATFSDLEMQLRRRLSTRVTVAPQRQGARITIDCYSSEELAGVLAQLLGEGEEEE